MQIRVSFGACVIVGLLCVAQPIWGSDVAMGAAAAAEEDAAFMVGLRGLMTSPLSDGFCEEINAFLLAEGDAAKRRCVWAAVAHHLIRQNAFAENYQGVLGLSEYLNSSHAKFFDPLRLEAVNFCEFVRNRADENDDSRQAHNILSAQWQARYDAGVRDAVNLFSGVRKAMAGSQDDLRTALREAFSGLLDWKETLFWVSVWNQIILDANASDFDSGHRELIMRASAFAILIRKLPLYLSDTYPALASVCAYLKGADGWRKPDPLELFGEGKTLAEYYDEVVASVASSEEKLLVTEERLCFRSKRWCA